MAKGKKSGGRNFKKGNRGRPHGAKDKLPRTLKGNLKAVLEEIATTQEPMIYTRLVGMLKGKQFFQALQFLAHYTVDKTLKVQPDLSHLTEAELQTWERLMTKAYQANAGAHA
jgi:hypothetical protein